MIGQTHFIRLLRKLATEREMRGVTELRTGYTQRFEHRIDEAVLLWSEVPEEVY
ncbi:hypothetical protein Ltuc_0476 [Legionella tucsonensis]|uniref:Uncharacterized protein n=1 Tax=Legionella tucsonensis TaxID=40335 RepID=A0A0W0ZTZ8_9GAMM|nr:hypothetical protein Ltuc_0476 [Legionella tucsonensis]